MKTILILFTVMLTCKISFGQTQNDDYKRMIDSAVSIQKMPSRNPEIYLLDSKDQAYQFTSDIDQSKFASINIFDKKNKKLLEKGIKAWKVFPVLKGNKLIIGIVDFTITYKNNVYNFSNGGGANIIFEYSCDESRWIYKGSNWSGI